MDLSNILYVIWDWNGTLINDVDICLEIFNKQLEKAGKQKKTLEEYKNIFTFPLKNIYEKLGFDFSKYPYNDIAQNFALEYNKKRFNAKLSDGVKDFIVTSIKEKKIKHYVLSAYNQTMLEEALKYYDIYDFFFCVKGLNNVLAHGKKEIGKEIIKQIPFPDKTVLIGDTLHDYDVAKYLNVTPILYTGGYDSAEKLKKTDAILIDNFSQLYKILKIKNEP